MTGNNAESNNEKNMHIVNIYLEDGKTMEIPVALLKEDKEVLNSYKELYMILMELHTKSHSDSEKRDLVERQGKILSSLSEEHLAILSEITSQMQNSQKNNNKKAATKRKIKQKNGDFDKLNDYPEIMSSIKKNLAEYEELKKEKKEKKMQEKSKKKQIRKLKFKLFKNNAKNILKVPVKVVNDVKHFINFQRLHATEKKMVKLERKYKILNENYYRGSRYQRIADAKKTLKVNDNQLINLKSHSIIEVNKTPEQKAEEEKQKALNSMFENNNNNNVNNNDKSITK